MIKVLQLICPTGYYGAERWVVMLSRNVDPAQVVSTLAIVHEPDQKKSDLGKQFEGDVVYINTRGRFDTHAIFALRKLISEREIDIIHTHGYKSDFLGLLSGLRKPVRCLATPHGYGLVSEMSFKRRLYHKVGAFSLRHFDSVVPLSQALFEETRALGVSEEKMELISNGVDLSEIDAIVQPAHENAVKHQTIGYVGQLIPRKRVHIVLEVFNSLWKSHPNLRLKLIGDGPERERLEAISSKMECSESVEFTGFLGDRLSHVANFDVMLLASAQEGIPRVAMEAMALRIPIVAFDIPGLDVLVESGRSGVLVKDGDISALCEACRGVIDNPHDATSLGKAARSRIEANFSGESVANAYSQHFKTMLM